MASSRKKAIVRTVTNQLLHGYLPLTGLLDHDSIALLDLEGRILSISLANVRTVSYVRDFNLNDRDDPERLTRRTFMARPRSEGLWVRITFSGGDILEGLAPLDVALLDNLLEDRGLFLIPPDIRSNTQRVFVPRAAIASLQVLAVITTPSKAKAALEALPLFPDPS